MGHLYDAERIDATIDGYDDDVNPVRNDFEGGGEVTVGTSEVEITFSGTTTSIILSADSGNTGIIFVGKTGVLNDGSNHLVKLGAGDDVILDYDDSVNAIFVISDAAAQTVSKGALL